MNIEVTTFAGKQEGLQNSHELYSQLRSPYQFVYSKRENSFFVADNGNTVIKKVSMEGKDD